MVESVSKRQNPRQLKVPRASVEVEPHSSGTGIIQGQAKAGKADPVLDAVVAKLRSVKFSSEPKSGPGIQEDSPMKTSSPCDCERSLKLILCGA